MSNTPLNCSELAAYPQMQKLCESVATVNDVNVVFLLWASAQVFSMHTGFAMLSAGAVRSKNTKNILISIVLDACVCAMAWWFVGYAFAWGKSNDGFIGSTYFVGIGMGQDYSYQDWFFQYAFAATAATIVSGCVAERATFEAYMTYSFLLSAWVYPVVVHWIWSPNGWLTINSASGPLLGVGALDFAGCGPVHMVGGVAGAIGGKIIGARIGRYDEEGKPRPIPGHSSSLAILGLFFLWVGWFSFNPGSVIAIAPGRGDLAARAAVNTVLSSTAGAISALVLRTAIMPGLEWDVGYALNGCLAGLVSITACCAAVESWAGVVIGIIGGMFFVFASWFTLNVLKIDDPLDATPVHCFCGMLGLIVTGFFANPAYVADIANFPNPQDPAIAGIFYGGNGALLACEVIEILVIIAWVTAFMLPYFYFLNHFKFLRVSEVAELAGLDRTHHGGVAYPEMIQAGEADSLLHNKSRHKERPPERIEFSISKKKKNDEGDDIRQVEIKDGDKKEVINIETNPVAEAEAQVIAQEVANEDQDNCLEDGVSKEEVENSDSKALIQA